MHHNSLKNRLKASARNLRANDFLCFVLHKLLTKIISPNALTSFSQFGEDQIIDSEFKNVINGFYVDVGCNHPISYSNTWKLYQRGWNGIAIDANSDLTESFAKRRKNDHVVTGAIADETKDVEFYVSVDSDLISGIGKKEHGHWQRNENNCKVIRCTTERLDSVLERYNAPNAFEFLNIDTEGNELDVLLSLNFSRYKPRLICVEIHEFDVSEPEQSPVYKLLTDNGYEVVGITGPSIFFRQKT